MKQSLKDTLELWISIIVAIVFLFALIGLPILMFEKIGVGVWQFIACMLWVTFWVSFFIVADTRDVEQNEESENNE